MAQRKTGWVLLAREVHAYGWTCPIRVALLAVVTVYQRYPAIQFAVTSNECRGILQRDLPAMPGSLIWSHKEVLIQKSGDCSTMDTSSSETHNDTIHVDRQPYTTLTTLTM